MLNLLRVDRFKKKNAVLTHWFLKVSCGKLNKEIADDLDCETNTIRKHMQHIFQKLLVQNRTEACIKFMEITGKLKTVNE